jgi:hypothetical protein
MLLIALLYKGHLIIVPSYLVLRFILLGAQSVQ